MFYVALKVKRQQEIGFIPFSGIPSYDKQGYDEVQHCRGTDRAWLGGSPGPHEDYYYSVHVVTVFRRIPQLGIV